MHAGLLSQATSHCLTHPNVEVCGLGLLKGDNTVTLYPCSNSADDPSCEFHIGFADYQAAARIGRPLWAYHSHPRGPGEFSEADRDWAEEHALRLFMRDGTTGKWTEHIPNSYTAAPLEGRPFLFGEADCYSLIRDYYRLNHGIHLTDYPRDDKSPWPELGRLVMERIATEGFVQHPAGALLKKGDILIFRTNGSPQHFAIWAGDSRVIHHPMGALSRKDLFGPAWQRRLHCVCRYSARAL